MRLTVEQQSSSMLETLAFILNHPILWAKICGAVLGSSIAVIFQPADDTNKRLFARFIIGVVIGVVFSPVLIDWVKLEHTWDYWLASATFCGSIGVLALQVLFSQRVYDAVESRTTNQLKK